MIGEVEYEKGGVSFAPKKGFLNSDGEKKINSLTLI